MSWYYSKEVERKTGMKRNAIDYYRNGYVKEIKSGGNVYVYEYSGELVRGVDWDNRDGRVVYSQSGLDKLMEIAKR